MCGNFMWNWYMIYRDVDYKNKYIFRRLTVDFQVILLVKYLQEK